MSQELSQQVAHPNPELVSRVAPQQAVALSVSEGAQHRSASTEVQLKGIGTNKLFMRRQQSSLSIEPFPSTL